jgi:hypothetical protein
MAFLIWVASFARRSIRWRGTDYCIRGGTLLPGDQKNNSSQRSKERREQSSFLCGLCVSARDLSFRVRLFRDAMAFLIWVASFAHRSNSLARDRLLHPRRHAGTGRPKKQFLAEEQRTQRTTMLFSVSSAPLREIFGFGVPLLFPQQYDSAEHQQTAGGPASSDLLLQK